MECRYNAILFTLGNLQVQRNTLISESNIEPDTNAHKRSQEFYDALNGRTNIVAWANSRYRGGYSKELSNIWADKIRSFINKIDDANISYDFSIQMCGHPNLVQCKPYFIVVDFMPYQDLSILDKVPFPDFARDMNHEHAQLYKNAKGVITFSALSRDSLIKVFDLDPRKVTTICTGCLGHVNESYIKSPEKIILWAGQNFAPKGGYVLLDAFEMLRKEDDSYQLYMVGADFKVNRTGVVCMPFLHGKDLSILDDLYKKAKLFVMPSLKENLGIVYLEAMARKTPVVCTTRGGLADIIRKTRSGEIVIPVDSYSLFCAMHKLINDDKLYESYSRNAFYFSTKNTVWDIVISRTLDAIGRWMKGQQVLEDYNDYT